MDIIQSLEIIYQWIRKKAKVREKKRRRRDFQI